MSNNRRVSIQYSIDESQIGDECHRLLTNTLTRLTNIVAESPDSDSIMNVSTITEIKSLRQELSQIDIQLDDVNAIIDGFLNFQYGENTNISADSQTTENIGIPDFLNSNPQDIDLSQLSSFVEQLKNKNTDNFDPNVVENIAKTFQQAAPNVNMTPSAVSNLTENAKNIDPSSPQSSELLSMLSNISTSGGPSIDEIEKKLSSLKSRIDNNEVTD